MAQTYPPSSSAIKAEGTYPGIRYRWSNERDEDKQAGLSKRLLMVYASFAIIFIALILIPQIRSVIDDGFTMKHLKGLPTLMILGGSIMGGLHIYRVFRKPLPALLQIDQHQVIYETGTRSARFNFPQDVGNVYQKSEQKSVVEISKNKKFRCPIDELHTLKLEEVGAGLRLSIHHKSQWIEIGSSLPSRDKEWLHGVLAELIPGAVKRD